MVTDFKQKSQVLEGKYQENNSHIWNVMYIILRESSMHGRKRLRTLCLLFLYRFSTRFEDIEAAYELAQSLREYYEERNDEVALMKCDMIMLNVYLFLDAVHLKGEILSISQRAIRIFEHTMKN